MQRCMMVASTGSTARRRRATLSSVVASKTIEAQALSNDELSSFAKGFALETSAVTQIGGPSQAGYLEVAVAKTLTPREVAMVSADGFEALSVGLG